MSTDHTLLISKDGRTTISLDEHSSIHDLRFERKTRMGDLELSVKDLNFDDLTDLALRMLTVATYSDGDEAVQAKVNEWIKDPYRVTRGPRKQS